MRLSSILSASRAVGLVCCLTFFGTLAAARTGTGSTGGGDLCENRIDVIRNDLASWIMKGGARGLKFQPGLNADLYTDAMMAEISAARVRCVSEGDEGYPVVIGRTAKVCRFDKWEQGRLITCDFSKFIQMGESEQYVLVHHEFAGLAGLENPNGERSTYDLSNQITGFLENQIVKRLAIRPGKTVAWKQKVVALNSIYREVGDTFCQSLFSLSSRAIEHTPLCLELLKKELGIFEELMNPTGVVDVLLERYREVHHEFCEAQAHYWNSSTLAVRTNCQATLEKKMALLRNLISGDAPVFQILRDRLDEVQGAYCESLSVYSANTMEISRRPKCHRMKKGFFDVIAVFAENR